MQYLMPVPSINWDCCDRKGIWLNSGGMMAMESPIAQMRARLPLLSSPHQFCFSCFIAVLRHVLTTGLALQCCRCPQGKGCKIHRKLNHGMRVLKPYFKGI